MTDANIIGINQNGIATREQVATSRMSGQDIGHGTLSALYARGKDTLNAHQAFLCPETIVTEGRRPISNRKIVGANIFIEDTGRCLTRNVIEN